MSSGRPLAPRRALLGAGAAMGAAAASGAAAAAFAMGVLSVPAKAQTSWSAPVQPPPQPNDGFSPNATDPSLDPITHGRPPMRVGPGRELRTLGQAAQVAQAGDVIEVDAGEYRGDAALAVWSATALVLRAVGGRVRLLAEGRHVEGKGIWVSRGQRLSVQGFDFEGATVHDHNGAGIRHEGGALFVRDCRFLHNETGIITGNEARTVLEVQDCEFGHNGHADGHAHNLYAGRIARLTVRGSWFHHAQHGHLLKSRAAFNEIFYNRLVDGPGGQASYELEFPHGGVAHVVGNLIGQAASTENRSIVAYGAEGYRGPRHELVLLHNTIVDDRALWGRTLWVLPGAGTLVAANNLLVGAHGLAGAENAAQHSFMLGNFGVDPDGFDASHPGQYRLHARSRLLARAVPLGQLLGIAANSTSHLAPELVRALRALQTLHPQRQYAHPRHSVALRGGALHPGAVQD